jgi:hypothetical protein
VLCAPVGYRAGVCNSGRQQLKLFQKNFFNPHKSKQEKNNLIQSNTIGRLKRLSLSHNEGFMSVNPQVSLPKTSNILSVTLLIVPEDRCT